jgi:hypothetical protein
VNAGSLINTGGLGNAGAAFIGGVLTVLDTTDSTSLANGAIHTDGGLGVTKAAFIGTTLGVGGITTITATTTSTSITTGACRRHPPAPDWLRWIEIMVLNRQQSGWDMVIIVCYVLRMVLDMFGHRPYLVRSIHLFVPFPWHVFSAPDSWVSSRNGGFRKASKA